MSAKPQSSFHFTVDNLAETPLTMYCTFCTFARTVKDLTAGMRFMREHFIESTMCRALLDREQLV